MTVSVQRIYGKEKRIGLYPMKLFVIVELPHFR